MTDNMNEKRLSSRVIGYWEKLRGEGERIPEIAKFRSNMLEDVWEQCIKVNINFSNGAPKFKFEHIGEDVSKAMGKKMQDQPVTGVANVPGGRILNRITLLLPQLSTPIQDHGEMLNEKNQMVKYRSCILPFGNKDGELTHVIIALSWRIFK